MSRLKVVFRERSIPRQLGANVATMLNRSTIECRIVKLFSRPFQTKRSFNKVGTKEKQST